MAKSPLQNQLDRFLPDPKRIAESFTRENIIAFLKALGWVVPLTILIWIYAEREQIATEQGRIIPIEIRTTAPNRIVTLISPPDKNIVAEMSGPRAQLDKVLMTLSRPGENEAVPVTIDVDPSLPPGRHPIASARAGDSPLFMNRGITVSDCRPPLLLVQVDALIERQVPIQASSVITNMDGPPTFTPSKVTLRGPQSVLDRLKAEGKLAVYANLADAPELQAPGVHELKNVPLMLPSLQAGEAHVSIAPASVTATIKVKQVEDRYVYPTMTIFVTTPYNFSDRYKVRLIGDPFIQNITLLGPQEVLSALRKDDFHPKPLARLTVTSDDLPPGTTHTRELKFELPDGVRVAPEDAHHSVQFTIEDASKD